MTETTTRRACPRLPLLAGAVALSACSARADIPKVVVTQSDVVFEGVPRIAGLPALNEISTTFDHPDGFELPEYFNPELYPVDVTVTARGDMEDLSFVEQLSLTLASRADDAPPQKEVATYERGNATAVGRELDVAADSEQDVLEYWGTDAAYYTLSLRSDQLPEETWSVDVTVLFRGRLSIGD